MPNDASEEPLADTVYYRGELGFSYTITDNDLFDDIKDDFTVTTGTGDELPSYITNNFDTFDIYTDNETDIGGIQLILSGCKGNKLARVYL